MNMMSMNWREAIKQAQQKIDKVLDIRPDDENEENSSQTASSSTMEEISLDDSESRKSEFSPNNLSSILAEDPIVVTLEPLLPPSSQGQMTGDDIQTIISSDIEILPEVITPNISPELNDCVDVPDLNETLRSNKWLKKSLEVEQKKTIELKEQNAKLSSKLISIEKEFESFKSEASKFSQEAFKSRQDAKSSRSKVAELTKELEALEEKIASRDTKIKGLKNAMDDNLAIVKKYNASNTSQSETIKKLNEQLNEKTKKIQELEALIDGINTKQQDEETGSMYMDDMLVQTVAGLKQDVEEYKRANISLTENLKKLEEENEQKQLNYENRMTDAVEATRLKYINDITELMSEREKLLAENSLKTEKEAIFVENMKKIVAEMKILKHKSENLQKDIKDLNSFLKQEIKRTNNETKRLIIAQYDEIVKNQVTLKINEQQSESNFNGLIFDKFVQTEEDFIEANNESLKTENHLQKSIGFDQEKCWCSGVQDRKFVANMSEMIKMIDELTFQKEQLETIKRTTDLDLKETRRQLSEVLIMHGEKMEEVEELRIDNEDLRKILKEQALSLTAE